MTGVSGGQVRVKYGGFAVALVGFLLTRFTVLEAVRTYDSSARFILAEGVTLILGLGLVVFGIGLAVSTLERRYVNTVATWCVAGTVGMLAITMLTVLEKVVYEMYAVPPTLSSDFVTTALIGGAVGGVLVGLRSAANHHNRRKLSRQAAQATVLNRILRHEVLNKTTVIDGYAAVLAEDHADDAGEPVRAIRAGARHINQAIENIGFLVHANTREMLAHETVDLTEIVSGRLKAARKRHPKATFEQRGKRSLLAVAADGQLEASLDQLLDNAVKHNDLAEPHVTVTVRGDDTTASVTVADDGPGLPASQRTLLTDRDLPEYDDPTAGFGLSIVALLADVHGWHVETDVEANPDRGTAITLTLPRVTGNSGKATASGVHRGVEPIALRNVAIASLIAGVVMGAILEAATGAIPIIGALYGVGTPAVGWITHLFHSVVFGMAFVAALTRPVLSTWAESRFGLALAGVGYGVLLWLFAAGFVMPIWLNAVGIPAPIPNLGSVGLAGHAIWGVVLALSYSALPE